MLDAVFEVRNQLISRTVLIALACGILAEIPDFVVVA